MTLYVHTEPPTKIKVPMASQIKTSSGPSTVYVEKEVVSFVLSINQYNVVAPRKGTNNYALLESLITFIKQIPASERTYDVITSIWTIPYKTFQVIFTGTIISPGTIISHSSLLNFCTNSGGDQDYNRRQKVKPPSEDNFFYSSSQPTTSANKMTLPEVEKAILQLCAPVLSAPDALVVDDKLYKKAARRLHPDINQGDGSKMSELNSLWQLYKSLK